MILTSLLSVSVVVVGAGEASASIPSFVKGYKIRATHDFSRCLDVARSYTGEPGQVVKYPCGEPRQANQVFHLRYVPDAYGAAYEFRPNHADDKCISVSDRSKENWALIITWTCIGHAAQKWRLIRLETTGYTPYLLQNVNSGRCISVPYGNGDDFWIDGAQMIQWTCDRMTRAQMWELDWYSD